MKLKLMGTVFLIPPLLSARYYGYGLRIDLALEKIHEMLADPAAQERIRNMQKVRRTIQGAVKDSEKPELSILE